MLKAVKNLFSQHGEKTAENYERRTLLAPEQIGDVARKLPPEARIKFEAMRSESAMLSAAFSAQKKIVRAEQEKKMAVERRIDDLKRQYPGNQEHGLILAEQKSLEEQQEKVNRLVDDLETKRPEAESAQAVVDRIETYLDGLDHSSLSMAPAQPEPKLTKGMTIFETVDQIRSKIAAARAELHTALDAPLPSEQAKEIARSFIRGIAMRGRPDVMVTIEGKRPPRFAESMSGPSNDVDLLATMAFVCKDLMIAAFEKAIDEDADDESALDDATRAKAIEKASRERLALERQEETLVMAGRQSYQPITRRHDCDPRAILNLADTCPAPDRMWS